MLLESPKMIFDKSEFSFYLCNAESFSSGILSICLIFSAKTPEISLNSIEPLIQKISELTKIQRIVISGAVVGLIIAGFVAGLYLPKYKKYGELDKNVKEKLIPPILHHTLFLII